MEVYPDRKPGVGNTDNFPATLAASYPPPPEMPCILLDLVSTPESWRGVDHM